MFADHFQLILMGFLTTPLHKNGQNDVKLLETWWFWHILGKGTHIYSNQKQPDFSPKITLDPNFSIKPCVHRYTVVFGTLYYWISYCCIRNSKVGMSFKKDHIAALYIVLPVHEVICVSIRIYNNFTRYVLKFSIPLEKVKGLKKLVVKPLWRL